MCIRKRSKASCASLHTKMFDAIIIIFDLWRANKYINKSSIRLLWNKISWPVKLSSHATITRIARVFSIESRICTINQTKHYYKHWEYRFVVIIFHDCHIYCFGLGNWCSCRDIVNESDVRYGDYNFIFTILYLKEYEVL